MTYQWVKDKNKNEFLVVSEGAYAQARHAEKAEALKKLGEIFTSYRHSHRWTKWPSSWQENAMAEELAKFNIKPMPTYICQICGKFVQLS